MIIMLEGPDLAGKTTLAKQLRRKVKNSEIIHRGPPTTTWQEEYLVPLLRMKERGGAYILDRWHVGELVYGPLFRGKSIVDDAALLELEALCNEMGVVRVFCLPAMNVLEERWKERGDDHVTSLTQLMDVAAEYQRLTLTPEKVKIDFIVRSPATPQHVGWIVSHSIHKAEAREWKV